MAPVARMATADDSRFLAEMMYASMLPGVGCGIFDAALGETGVDPVDFHEAMLLADASNWGQIADFLVLETAETPHAGAAAAYLSDRPDKRPLTAEGFEAVSKRLGWTPAQSRSFWRTYVRAFGLFGDAPQLAQPAAYVIEYIAVPEPLRGRGYARVLLDAHAARAHGLGHDRIAISAMFGNNPALQAYLRCGFHEHERLGPERFGHAFPGMVRLVRDLSRAAATTSVHHPHPLPPRMTV